MTLSRRLSIQSHGGQAQESTRESRNKCIEFSLRAAVPSLPQGETLQFHLGEGGEVRLYVGYQEFCSIACSHSW